MNEEEDLKEESKQQFDADVLNKLMAAGENQEGNVTIEPEDDINPETDKPLFMETDEKAKNKPGKIKRKLGKYAEKFIFDMKKNPEKYMIETPRGLMTIEEAIQQGYDPATKDFTDKGSKEAFEESLEGMSESSKEAIKRITSPETAQIPPAMAEGMGVEGESPMVAGGGLPPEVMAQMQAAQGAPQGAPQEQQVSPEMLAALGGGQ